MKQLIACCGLDCEKCEGRLATINDDDRLREKVTKEWGEMNQMELLVVTIPTILHRVK